MTPSRRSLALLPWCLAFVVWFAAGCASVPSDYPREPSSALPASLSTPLGDAAARLAAQHPDGHSGFRLLTRGHQALTARHAITLAAQRTLDVQYYIIGSDPTSRTMMWLAVQAAERGVRVRLLVDDIHSDGRDEMAAALARHPNFQVRVFNPFGVRGTMGFRRTVEFLWDNDRLNRRMHNKAMIADNAIAIVGGRNLAEEYFGANAATSFVDVDVLGAGPVVKQLSEGFDAYWNSPYAMPVQAFVGHTPPPLVPEPDDVLTPMPGSETMAAHLVAGTLPLQWAEAYAMWDKPEKVEGQVAAAREGVRIGPRIRQMILDAKSSVTLVSAYFVPRQLGVDQFIALAQAGVRVRVGTNTLAANDVIAAHGGYAHYRPALARGGVELYELRPIERDEPPDRPHRGTDRFRSRTSLHAKSMVIDRELLVVGSFNADPRSVWLNTETAVVIRSPALAQDLEAEADQVFDARCYRVRWQDNGLIWEREEGGRTVSYHVDPETTAWRRFLSRVVWAIAPEGSL